MISNTFAIFSNTTFEIERGPNKRGRLQSFSKTRISPPNFWAPYYFKIDYTIFQDI